MALSSTKLDASYGLFGLTGITRSRMNVGTGLETRSAAGKKSIVHEASAILHAFHVGDSAFVLATVLSATLILL